MTIDISRSQLDKLGERLRKGTIADSDLRLLDQYRRSFTDAYEVIVGAIRQQVGLEPTGRPAKSTTSIAEKLRRESIRLTQIQDISGCRLVVSKIADQDRVVDSMRALFSESIIIDRRQKPSHGYRAVHIIAAIERKSVEIQLRTELQQAWAELSEKLSDLIDPAIKYGGGQDEVRELLSESSSMIRMEEEGESELLQIQAKISVFVSRQNLTEQATETIMNLREEANAMEGTLAASRERTIGILRRFTDKLPNLLKGE